MKSQIQLVPATINDIDTIIVFQQEVSSKVYNAMNHQEIHNKIETGKTTVEIIKYKENVVGAIMHAQYFDSSNSSYHFIEDFVIDKEYRGKGIGGAVLSMMFCRFTGERFELEVHENNPALNLYNRNGFITKYDQYKNFWPTLQLQRMPDAQANVSLYIES